MSNKVTYSEIIEALSRKTGFSKNKSEAFTKELIKLVKRDLEEEGKAVITNFGSFSVKEVSERQGQNPQTGEPITIPAHKRVTFSPYKALREEVNAEYAHLDTELLGKKSEPAKAEPKLSPDKKAGGKRQQESKTGLMIAAFLLLVIVAIASGWFLMTADSEEMAAEQTAIETPQTPEAASEITEEPDTPQPEEQAMTNTGNAESQSTEAEQEQQALAGNSEMLNQEESRPVGAGTIYRVQQDEWYWVIAEKVYGESGLWPLLFQENQSLEDDPDQLYPSTGLEVPELEGTAQSPSKGDYRQLSEASMMVSEAYQRAGKRTKAEEYARLARKWERQVQE